MKNMVKSVNVSDKFFDILKQNPLRTRLWVSLQMYDYENWDNGDYKGDTEKLKEQLNIIIKQVERWVSDGMPK